VPLGFALEVTKARLRSETKEEVPLLDDRLWVMQEAGRVLLEKFDGRFARCVEAAANSAQKLVHLLTSNFRSFDDHATYQDSRGEPNDAAANLTTTLASVEFFKRAQITVADVWACFQGKSYGEFHDIDTITMFADYR
jgi:hypothetical protein